MTRCAVCPHVNSCVRPMGAYDAEVLLVGEAPGKDENRLEQPFVGKTGTELDMHFLPLSGLQRSDVFVTNAIMCLPTTSDGKLAMSNERDKALALACSAHHLFAEIEQVSPRIIVPMGAFACYVIDPTINLELHHGIPRETEYGTVFPMWHPAGGIHEPKKMLQIRTDWIRLNRFRHGNLSIWTDLYPNPDYAEVTSKSELRLLNPNSALGADTEFDPDGNPVCLTFSSEPGSGRLIRSSRTDLLSEFQRHLDERKALDNQKAPIIFHHWMADWPKVEMMGLDFPISLIRDSMIRIHLLGNLPKALKAFAYRELGMEMTDFEDVVFPYSIPRVIDYLYSIRKFDWPKPEPEMRYDAKDGRWKVYKAQGMNTKIKRFFTDLAKNPDKDILGSWDNWEDSHDLIQEKCGRFYKLDIRDVPFDKLLKYACRDSDATLRAWPILESITSNMAGKVQENWRI